jgi:hypothetical protein
VEEPRRLADLLGDRLGEREHVVVRARLDLADPLDVDVCALADRGGRLGGDRAQLRPGVHDRQLDVEPALEAAPVGPDGAHGGACVTGDQTGPGGSRNRAVAAPERVYQPPRRPLSGRAQSDGGSPVGPWLRIFAA